MTDPIPLRSLALEPVPSVVAFCEGLLERARAGEIRAIAVACETPQRSASTAFDLGDGEVARLVYGQQLLLQRLLAEGS